MKKIILPLLMLGCFISGVQPTSAFTWQKNLVSIDKPYTESVCYDGGVPVYEIDDNYITKDSPYIRAYYDKLIHHQGDTRSYAIRTSSRILQYAKPGVFQSTDDWNMYSTYLPKNVKEVMVFWPNKAHKVNFDNLTPSDRGKIIGQDVFNIKRFQSVNSGSPNSQRVNMKMFYSPGSSTPVSRDIDVNEYFSRNSEEGYECFGYTVRWCGDGVTDSNDGETCDDGKNNGKPGYCNSTCTKKPEKTYCGDGKIQKPSKNNPNGKGTTKISEECDPNHPDYKGKGTCNPKTCKLNPTPVDLSIKKYIENDDAQTASSAPLKGIGDTFNYVIKVKNIGKEQTRGTTTVYDTLPKAVKLSGTISASEWNCTTSGQQVTCTTDKKVAKDTYFPTIKIPVKVQETTETTVQNNAIVYNPNEDKAKSCLKDGKKPSANTENGGKTSTTGDTTNDKNCDQDGNNEDPAIFKIMKADLSIKKYAVSLDESNEKDG
ncbi:hypothetical protein KGV55_03775, partial [Candidatus Gracilibacteria bacterium]|nr:hypothetical protein [Candidatus Gracilibacteria bacterium]